MTDVAFTLSKDLDEPIQILGVWAERAFDLVELGEEEVAFLEQDVPQRVDVFKRFVPELIL